MGITQWLYRTRTLILSGMKSVAGRHPSVQTRVMIVDDDPRFRSLARTLLEAHGYLVVAEAADGAEALAAAKLASPDAAVLDVQLPDTDGLVLARTLRETSNGLRIILTSTDPTLVPDAALAESPALTFVPKDQLAITDLAPWLRA
jgi:two-component system nitrate/nitrite response regulator NarL